MTEAEEVAKAIYDKHKDNLPVRFHEVSTFVEEQMDDSLTVISCVAEELWEMIKRPPDAV